MIRSKKSLSVLRVEEALLKAGYKDKVKELNQTARSAKDAAASLNVKLGAIVKTLVFCFKRQECKKPAIALISGDKICDVEELQNEMAIEGKHFRIGAEEVKQITSYTIGGVSPVGLPPEIPIAIDEALFRFEEVWCAAGNQFFVFPISPKNLVLLTNGVVSSKIGISIDR